MNKNEQELFLELCNFVEPDKELIEKLLPENATPSVLGHIFFNRMQGVAYGTLKNLGLLGKLNREFRNSLSDAYQINTEKNDSFYKCVKIVGDALKKYYGRYIMLKGAVLCELYPAGYRTSNDIDLLVLPGDVTIMGERLEREGFKQGYIRNGEFVSATRREIIESRMTRGETVPYILEVNLPHMKFLEVDINFSLDYKNGQEDTVDMLFERAVDVDIRDTKIKSLCEYDFFIHLCSHLYKEATTFPWIKMNRDMTLYKFSDIYYIIDKFTATETEIMFKRASTLKMDDICSCVVMWTSMLFHIKNQYAIEIASKNLENKETFLHEVVVPAEKKYMLYSGTDIKERFFADNRVSLLREIEK